jgi:RimJ/RimL family protein N-acetyltransferase
VGIDICEDAYLNRGYGTEALCLWVDHQFTDDEDDQFDDEHVALDR